VAPGRKAVRRGLRQCGAGVRPRRATRHAICDRGVVVSGPAPQGSALRPAPEWGGGAAPPHYAVGSPRPWRGGAWPRGVGQRVAPGARVGRGCCPAAPRGRWSATVAPGGVWPRAAGWRAGRESPPFTASRPGPGPGVALGVGLAARAQGPIRSRSGPGGCSMGVAVGRPARPAAPPDIPPPHRFPTRSLQRVTLGPGRSSSPSTTGVGKSGAAYCVDVGVSGGRRRQRRPRAGSMADGGVGALAPRVGRAAVSSPH